MMLSGVKKYLSFGGLMAAMVSFSVTGTENKSPPIMLAEQGNFAAGGTVAKTAGVFDGKKLFESQGQTLHGDHASVSYQIPVKARRYPLVFYTALASLSLHGGRHLMVARAFRQDICVTAIVCILLINHVEDEQVNPQCLYS